MTGSGAVAAAPTVGVLRETSAGERRVAITPDGVTRLRKAGFAVAVEAGAGESAWFPDAAYLAAGADVVDRHTLGAVSDILVGVRAPADRPSLHAGQILIGLLAPLTDLPLARELAEAKVTAISLDGLPRTLSSAQSMDARSLGHGYAGVDNELYNDPKDRDALRRCEGGTDESADRPARLRVVTVGMTISHR